MYLNTRPNTVFGSCIKEKKKSILLLHNYLRCLWKYVLILSLCSYGPVWFHLKNILLPPFMGFFDLVSQTTLHCAELSVKILLLVTVHPGAKLCLMQLPGFFVLFQNSNFSNPFSFSPTCIITDQTSRAGNDHPIHFKSRRTLAVLFSSRVYFEGEGKEKEKMSMFHKNTILRYNDRTRCGKVCGFTPERKKIPQVQTTLRKG